MVLLTAISRRIVDELLPFEVDSNGRMVGKVDVGVHLPYAGAYLIYRQAAVRTLYRDVLVEHRESREQEVSDGAAVRTLYRDVLVGNEPATSHLWQTVQLRAYPFRLELSPAFTLLVSMRDNASNFHTRHTLLKSRPTQVFLSQNASFNVLIDDAVQETVDRDLVEAICLVRRLADMPGLDRREFINALLTGHDPVEAAYLAARRPREQKGDTFRLVQAQRFWDREEVAAEETAEKQWKKFNQLAERVRDLAQKYPTLLSLV
jgi:hypothetical protein